MGFRNSFTTNDERRPEYDSQYYQNKETNANVGNPCNPAVQGNNSFKNSHSDGWLHEVSRRSVKKH